MKAAKRTMLYALLAVMVIVAAGSLPAPAAAAASWQWKQQSGKESSAFKGIAVLNNGTRLVIGDDTAVFRSVKEGRWSPAVIPGKGDLKAIATDGKAAVVVGENGIAARSLDGVKWTNGALGNTVRLDQFDAYYKNKPEGKLTLKMEGIRWMDIIWDGKQYAAVGEGTISDGKYNYSYPLAGVARYGTTWQVTPLVTKERVLLFDQDLQLVKFKNSWFALAREGVFYSRDLKTWSFKKVDLGADIHAAAASGDTLVVVGWDGRSGTGRAIGGAVFTSEDGLSYKRQPGGSFYNISLNTVIWADNRFVAAGHYGTLFESADGKKWTERTQEHGELMSALYYVKYSGLKGNIYGIAKTKEGYTAVGAVGAIRSAQGIGDKWKLEASGNKGDLYGIAYTKGQYAIAGTGTFLLSKDGGKWEDAGTELVNDMTSLYNLYSVSGAFVASGFQLTAEKLSKADLLHSSGKMTSIQSALAEPIDDISSTGGALRVFGEKLAASSKDGVKWTSLKGVQAIPIATNSKLWLGYRGNNLYSSKDGVSWSKMQATLDGYAIYYPMKEAIWTGSKFVANNEDELIESVNGKEWKSVLKLSYEYFNGLAVNGAGTAVAVGDKGMIYMSEKGKAWTKVNSPTTKTLRSVIWDGKRFMAVGDGGVVIVAEPK